MKSTWQAKFVTIAYQRLVYILLQYEKEQTLKLSVFRSLVSQAILMTGAYERTGFISIYNVTHLLRSKISSFTRKKIKQIVEKSTDVTA